ncbi:YqcC family protein [Ferrimonas marina]|uniref:tRNA pseudouridine synthase C n=1 Tax=Ferrimonas marina TaxID=299255 RepID=A0A1M5YG47_9GAMM|nr:YqcC family protein [Ferrimonas marina]SHI10879.1 tRNA pseudouridine synthase C [Ferrimonas marina]
MHDRHLIHSLLAQLQAALQQAQLWQSSPPSAEALASRQPFACDTLRFEQWVQFLYLPRLQQLMEAGQALPTKVAVAPMAEESWRGRSGLDGVVDLLAQLDRALSQPEGASGD